jgi:hypothetical protein
MQAQRSRGARILRRARRVAVLVVIFGPIALGAWHVHVTSRRDPARLDPAPPHAADYLSRRSPAVDRLLPEGRGGTYFYEDLGGVAGRANLIAASISLSTSDGDDAWPEAVELHERAHLVHAFLPTEAAAIMARLPPPADDEYAATNRREHFAEMAAKAWAVVAPPDGFCLGLTPAAHLTEVEARVPGTAGFVLRYLQQMPLPPEGGGDLVATAERLSAPQRGEWDALWRHVEARRRPDGTFEPWAFATIREYIDAKRAEMATSGGWMEKMAAVALLPSLLILTLVGR